MPKLIMTKGLPGSGKSTWAKEYQRNNPSTVRTNKDELRAMMHQSFHSKGREGAVLAVRDFIVIQALHDGHDVIVDDTNFNPIHQTRLEELAKMHKSTFEIKDFSDVPLEQCIKNDLKRFSSVGKDVIMEMYKRYLRPKPLEVEYVNGARNAIICDLDGTLALFGENNPYDRDFEADKLNDPVHSIIARYAEEGIKILLVSGREGKFREQTENWLKRHGIHYDILLMRVTGDKRKDSIVKDEIYQAQIKGKYNISFVLDDRDQVVEYWRSQGLTVFQVAEGDF